MMSPTGSPPAMRSFSMRSVGAHLAQRGDQAGAQRVQADILDDHARSRHQQRRHDGKGGGGRVARHHHRRGDQFRLALQRRSRGRRACRVTDTVAPKWRSMFSVWSRVGFGFHHARGAGRAQPGQQARPISPAPRRPAARSRSAAGRPRRAPPAAGGRPRACQNCAPHGRQRVGHALHRAAAQGCIAGHHREDRMARQQPQQQPRRRCRNCPCPAHRPVPAARRRRARPRARRRRRSASTSAPSARMAAAVRSTSSPSSRPVMSVVPTASAPNIRARWLIDLSPGTPRRPASGAEGAAARSGRGAGWDMAWAFDMARHRVAMRPTS